jgi:hypothetical protein
MKTRTRKETMLKNALNRKLFSDDLLDEERVQCELYYLQNGNVIEFDSEWDKDLLSGHDMIDFDVDFDEDYICLDSYFASTIIRA